MLFSAVALAALAGSAAAFNMAPQHQRLHQLLPRQEGGCTDQCQGAYQAVQDCYQESDLEAIAQCSCGDQVLGALRECSSCAADTDSLTEAEKQSLQSNLDDLDEQCSAGGFGEGGSSGSLTASGSDAISSASGSPSLSAPLVPTNSVGGGLDTSESMSSDDTTSSSAADDDNDDNSSEDDNDDSSAPKAGFASAALALTGVLAFFA